MKFLTTNNYKSLRKTYDIDKINNVLLCFVFLSLLPTRLDQPVKGLSVRIFFINLIIFLFYNFIVLDSEIKMLSLKRVFRDNVKMVSINIFLLFIEIINYSNINNFMFFIQLLITSNLVILNSQKLLNKKNYNSFFFMFSKMMLVLSLLFIIYTIFILVLPNEILYIDGNNYQVTSYHYSISIRQRISDGNRFSSMFSNPNQFGFFGFLVFYINLLNFSLNNNSNKKKIQIYFTAVVVMTIMILTKSRSSILASILLLFMCSFNHFKNILKMTELSQKKLLNYSKAVGAVFSFIILVFLIVNRGSLMNLGRIGPWQFAYGVFKENIIKGIGTSLFLNMIKEAGYLHAHNSYLQILASGGILFLMVFSYLSCKIISMIFEVESSKLKTLFLSFFITISFYNLFENIYLVIHPIIFIFAITFKVIKIIVEGEKLS